MKATTALLTSKVYLLLGLIYN